MAVHVLRRRVRHDVRPEVEGTAEDRRREGVVDVDPVDHLHAHVHGFQQCVDGGEDGALGPDEVVGKLLL